MVFEINVCGYALPNAIWICSSIKSPDLINWVNPFSLTLRFFPMAFDAP